MSPALASGFFTNEPPGKPRYRYVFKILISFPLDIVPELKLLDYKVVSLVAQMVKRLPTMRETRVQSLGQEDLLEKEMATHSSILAWKIPWMEEPGRLQSMGSQRVRHD